MVFDTRLLTGVGVPAAVTEAGNFARAAEMLGLTPSAVSRAVARLEARVGVRLFDRNPREVSLTEEGRRFHTQVMPLLAGLDEAAAEAAGRRRSCAAGCAYRWTRGSHVSCLRRSSSSF
jgi:DNA-binding transcriptional LysR family regulator